MNVLAVGEILWDILPGGNYLGGAPFNVLAHMRKMGHRASLFTAVGRDEFGHKALVEINRLEVNTTFVQQNEHPTSTVSVSLVDGQPHYIFANNVAWDYLTYDVNIQEMIQKETFDLVIFGTLAQRNIRSAAVIHEVIRDTKAGHIFLDVNFRQNFYTKENLIRSLAICTILKTNESEMMMIRSMLHDEKEALRSMVERLAKEYQINLICITRGGDGAWVFADRKWYKQDAPVVEIKDTIGAGDSFSAAFLHTYLRTHNIPEALNSACQLGAFVASKSGAIPDYSDEIRRRL